MTDNRAIFDTLKPWLDGDGWNKPGRTQAMDTAIAAFLASGDKSTVYEAARDWLDREGYTPRRINALDTALSARRLSVSVESPGWLDHVAPGDGGGATGLTDDRYLPLFQRLAAPTANPDTVKAVARAFAAHATAYGQDASKARIADFAAQISNETGGFTRFEEDLRYRAATMLRQWPSHFTAATAAASVGKPVEIASRAYGGRMGNAPYPSQDGYLFRGRGALQLTGRAAYRLMGQRLNLPLEQQPDLAADPATSVLIALEFYKERGVNAAIDAGDTDKARHITNGGSIGLPEVNRRRQIALGVLA